MEKSEESSRLCQRSLCVNRPRDLLSRLAMKREGTAGRRRSRRARTLRVSYRRYPYWQIFSEGLDRCSKKSSKLSPRSAFRLGSAPVASVTSMSSERLPHSPHRVGHYNRIGWNFMRSSKRRDGGLSQPTSIDGISSLGILTSLHCRSIRLPYSTTFSRALLAVRPEGFHPRLHGCNHVGRDSWIRRTIQLSASWLTIVAMLIASIVATEVTQASIVSDNPAGWQLTFTDEFSGMSLDDSKWSHRGLGARRDAINTANAVSVGEGLLTITTYTSGGVHYTGMIATQGKFEQTFGYYEARMRFHSTPGEWSAFWLQSPTYGAVGDPASTGMEIDVVEHRAANRNNTDIRNRYSSAIHWDGYNASHQQLSKVHLSLPGMGNDSWHTYGVKWSESGYDYYYDDMLVWTAAAPVSTRSEYLILSSEVEDGAWAGTVPVGGYGSLASSVTNVQVDYVRAFSAVAAPPSSADFNFDGHVDGSDFLIWQRNANAAGGATRIDGNANAGVDGDVDADDLAIWKLQYGNDVTTTVAVPEPTSPTLFALAIAVALGSLLRSNSCH